MNIPISRCLTLCVITLATWAFADSAGAVGTRRFELSLGKDFKGGDLQGVAIDGAGRVHAGLNLGAVPVSDAQAIWSTLPRGDGSLLLATGNEGKLLELRGGSIRQLAETDALVLTSLLEAWNGDVLVGAMPTGQILRYRNGQLEKFVALEGAEHVWGLAFDRAHQLVYAATGPEGKLFRIDAAGRAEVHFDAEEAHLMSVAAAPRFGGVYVGGSDKAKLYEVRAPGRANVLHDFGRTEVRAIAVAPSGEVYAVANQIKAGTAIPSPKSKSKSRSKTSGKGVLFRFQTDGTPEQLLASETEHYTSLTIGVDGRPYVGTGVEGRIYTVDESHNEILVADTDERQIGTLVLDADHQFVGASDPAVVHPVRGVGGPDAVWTSKPLDAGLRAYFGRLSWAASGPLQLSTRSGNTSQPDDTWSAWSTPIAQPGRTQTPAARYVQIRARWGEHPSATLSHVTLAFVTDNLRAVLTSVDVEEPKDERVSAGSSEVGSSGGPVTKEADPIIKLKWKVDNPDADELRYRLQYRMLGTRTWLDVLKPGDQLVQSRYEWDTSDLPEGRYRIRVQASDELSNPPARVKRHELTSAVVLVDNTPPAFSTLEAHGRKIRGTAVDGVGPIARIEVGVAGSGEWYPFFPRDGIYDEQSEDFDVDASTIVPEGPVLVSVRIYDQGNNFVVRHLNLR